MWEVLIVLLTIVSGSYINLDTVNSLNISYQTEESVSVIVSSNPSAGLIWVLIPDSQNKIDIDESYGEFFSSGDVKSGYQLFSISCNYCRPGDKTYILLALMKPWKEYSSYVRKIIINVV